MSLLVSSSEEMTEYEGKRDAKKGPGWIQTWDIVHGQHLNP